MISVFTYRKVTCPVCEKESTQTLIMPNNYRVEEKEADQHPVKITWTNPDNADLKPQYYVLYHCPYCLFTDFDDTFLKPSSVRNFISLKKLFTTSNPVKSKLLAIFKSKINCKNMKFESALLLHLLSIYIYELETRKDFKNVKKLARIYHRTAWLYREELANEKKDTSDLEEEMRENIDALKSSFNAFKKKFDPLNENIKHRVGELNINFDSPDNPYLKLVTDFNSHSEQLQKAINGIQMALDEDKKQKEAGMATYRDDLAVLAELWPTVPMTEKDCLDKAIDYYEAQYQTLGGDGESLGLQISLMNLMVELCVMTHNFKKAIEYLVSLYQFCSKSRQDLYAQQRSGGGSGIDAQINKLSDLISSLSEKKKVIESKYSKYSNRVISNYVKKHPDLSWEEVKEVMLGRDIPEDFIEEYETKGEMEESDDNDDEQPEEEEKE